MKVKLRKSQKVGIAGLLIIVYSLLYLYVILPPIMKWQVKKKVALKNGWPMRDIWNKLPFTTEIHMYLFNVTNHMDIGNGAKPIVQQIGPFVYDVHQEKIKRVDHEEDDSVSYVPMNLYYFNRFKSNGLSDDLEIYFPHLFLMTVSNGLMKDSPLHVSWTSRGADTLMNRPSSAFYKLKVRTILFEGMPIRCAGVEEYFGKVLCNEMRDRYYEYTLRKKGDTYYTSMYGFLNGTYDKEKPVRIKRGLKNLKELGTIVEANGKTSIDTWKDDICDSFEGTDATIFPPFLNTNGKDSISIVYQLACRKLKLHFHNKVKYRGLKLLRYTGDLGTDGDHVPEEKCYCIHPDRCLKKGMFELYRCINVPVIVSNPHFYMADPYYLTTVDSLAPDKEKHMLYIDFDPLSGSPVRAHVRVQFNFELFPIEKFRLAQNYTYSMLPVLWVDDVFELPDYLIKELKMAHLLITVATVFGYLLIVGGIGALLVAAFLEYRAMTSAKTIDLKPMRFRENFGNIESKQDIIAPGSLHAAPVPANLD